MAPDCVWPTFGPTLPLPNGDPHARQLTLILYSLRLAQRALAGVLGAAPWNAMVLYERFTRP
jgi:hypothetical protein